MCIDFFFKWLGDALYFIKLCCIAHQWLLLLSLYFFLVDSG